MAIGYNELGIPPKRKVLYRNFHNVSGQIYLVEISRSPKKVFILLFANFERPDEFLAEVLMEKVASKLMHDNGNVFENLVQQFYVKFGKLQIIGYHGKGSTRKHATVPPSAKLDPLISAVLPQSQVVKAHAYGAPAEQREFDDRDPYAVQPK